jgi:hypothetical protein
VLDGVGIVQESFLKELLKVVHGLLCLMLAAVCDGRGACHDGAASLHVDTAIVIGRGCGLLAALLTPLLAALTALLSILDDDNR